MEGQGSIEQLRSLLDNATTAPRYKHLVEADGATWVVRDDVYVRYNANERKGKLTTGFGWRTHRLGPELEFGHVVGNVHDETVLIIKTTWGGSSLAADFRPPSSGEPKYEYDLIGDDGTTQSALDKKPGHRYYDMIDLIRETLEDINYVIPEYDGFGYEIVGFVWFQGFSDVVDVRKIEEYAENLKNLCNDVRRDLKQPNMPITVGELGMEGLVDPGEKHLRMREIQRNITQVVDGKVAFAEIAKYTVATPTDGWDFDGPGHFHYNGRADNFIEIGRCLAEAALSLLDDEDQSDFEGDS
jgi:alpha-galactosidase